MKILQEQTEAIKKHFNEPQLKFMLINCNKNFCNWGRSTGKSEGPGAWFTTDNIHKMPRSNGFIMGTTYVQIIMRTLPALIAGWEKLGYFQNVHFWVRKYPPASLKVPKAYRYPQDPDHYIQWYNGSGIYLVSQDRPGTINGVRTQWGFIDEARFINKAKFDEEVIPTMSGQADVFGHLSNYLSLLFCSDLPRNSKGKWLVDSVKEMDEEIINGILQLQKMVITLKQKNIEELVKSKKTKIESEIKQLESAINDLRRDATYVSFASTLDNIHAMGFKAIRNLKHNLSPLEFKISVLNQQINQVENGFYSYMDDDKHGYDAVNYEHLDEIEDLHSLEIERNCLWDSDVNLTMPLDVSADFNNAINCLLIGQRNTHKWRFLNALYVLRPELLKDCANKFVEYYKYHRTKEVNFIHDNTAIAKNASTDVSFADEWISILEANGWYVRREYTGQASSHTSRYYAWSQVLEGTNKSLPRFEFNKTNCLQWKRSCEGAGIKQIGDTFKKDKSNERDINTSPQDATHLSEAGDGLFMYWYNNLYQRIIHTDRIQVR